MIVKNFSKRIQTIGYFGSGKFSVSKAFGDENFFASLKKDANLMLSYTTAVDYAIDKTDAWNESMAQASATAQKFVKDHQDTVGDINRLSSIYARETTKNQLGKSVEGSFTGAINAIRLYNMGVKSAGLTTKEFHEAIAEANPELDAYITKMEADGKKPTEWGFIWQTKKATIQTGLFTAGISIGTAVLGAFARYAKGDAAQSAARLTGGIVALGGAALCPHHCRGVIMFRWNKPAAGGGNLCPLHCRGVIMFRWNKPAAGGGNLCPFHRRGVIMFRWNKPAAGDGICARFTAVA